MKMAIIHNKYKKSGGTETYLFALTKGEGQGWSWGLEPYEDELYLTLAKIFGSYSWPIYLYENTADSEERLCIYVSEDSIETEVFEP